MKAHNFTSNFEFLADEFPILTNLAKSAEYYLHTDPNVALSKLRIYGEQLVKILFDEHYLEVPYHKEDTFSNRLKELKYENIIPQPMITLLYSIKNKGNKASHQYHKISINDATSILLAAFKLGKWLQMGYGEETEGITGLQFVKPPDLDPRKVVTTLEEQFRALESRMEQIRKERDELKTKVERDLEKEKIRQKRIFEVAEEVLDEEETRLIIDEQLRQAGWEADSVQLNFHTQKTLPQDGRNMAIAEWRIGQKRADYALFIGKKLYGIVEAKRFSKDVYSDVYQAKDYYAKLVTNAQGIELLGEWEAYKVPFVFATNGRAYHPQLEQKSGIWMVDCRKATNHPKVLRGWYSPFGLENLMTKNIALVNQNLKNEPYSYLKDKNGLNLRYYQINAIKAVEKTIYQGERNKALVAMATGTGKTRTIVGLCYRLLKSERFSNILFLVDRNLLGSQAKSSFNDASIEQLRTFGDIYNLKGFEESPQLRALQKDIQGKSKEATKVHFATVQGMIQRIFNNINEDDVPTVNTYDCIIVDEAHRGYILDKEIDEDQVEFRNHADFVSKYKQVIDYFDAFVVGLTATPAQHTTTIFGSPVFSYSYRQAVVDGYLIDHEPPYKIITKLNSEGIKWEVGEQPTVVDTNTGEIQNLDELEDELKFDVEHFNKKVITEPFNKTVCEYLVQYLEPDGNEKTLIFAATDEHADMVVRLLKQAFVDAGEPVRDDAIAKITGSVYKPKEQVRRYRNEINPNIVVTVDLLTTGVDVPSITNLVFLRRVKSRILYEQMLGRATRLCKEIDKEVFRIFDAVRLYEALEKFTNMKPVVNNPNFSFQDLAKDLVNANNDNGFHQLKDQIIAKFQRKHRKMKPLHEEQFQILTDNQTPEQFVDTLKSLPREAVKDFMTTHFSTLEWLDKLKIKARRYQLVSHHTDEFQEEQRGYGNATKPEDYIEGFKDFIENNRNKIAALQILCTKPSELTRADLKTLKLKLDDYGYNAASLNTAWRNMTNEQITTDIIAYIRSFALGNALVSPEERTKRAMKKVYALTNWTPKQVKWLKRIEKQLITETIMHVADFDEEPFKMHGGSQRLNSVLGKKLDLVVQTINENLFAEAG